MNSQTTLYELLEREFCPPVDSSLLTVLLADVNSDADGNGQVRSSEQIRDLRSLLKELASQAERDEYDLSEELTGVRLSDETDSTPELYVGDTTTCSEFSGSSNSQLSFSSPLGFLQAALPHIPLSKLNSAISNASGDVEVDMEFIVEGLLTDEYLRELEERGIGGLNSGDDSESVLKGLEDSWESVQTKKHRNSSINSSAGKRKTTKTKAFTLGDIRQKQHVRRNHSLRSQEIQVPVLDPWTQLSSLSAHIATLLPPHPPSFFLSFFHSPDYATPGDALRAALSSVCAATQTDSDKYKSVLSGLLDILLSSPEALDAEERSQVTSDTQLALNAAEGRGEDALDLIELLQDLHSDSASGYLHMGVYHGPPPPTTEAKPSPSISLPTTHKPKHKPPSSPLLNKKPSPFQWQAVPRRNTGVKHDPHPSAAFIPAYNTNNVRKNVHHSRGKVRSGGIGSNGDVGELSLSEAQWCRKRVGESMTKRNELLREASRAWQRGSAKTRGGEVAYYFAERAREVQEVARREALDEARSRVQSKRISCPDTVDLHGTTAAEAITIVKGILEQTGASPHKPLTVITGRGTHSANKVSVLRPALLTALVQDRWVVHTWDGGLTVRGKRGLTSKTTRMM